VGNSKIFILFILLTGIHAFGIDNFAGTGLEFDGTDDYIDLGTSADLKPTTALTVEMWVYSDWTSIINQRYICNTQTGGYNIGCDGTDFSATARLNGVYRTVSFPKSGIGEGYHHFALTCDGRYVKLYMDGRLMGTNDAGAVYPIQYNTVNSTLLGAEVGGGSTPDGLYMNGTLDEVRIWSIARTDQEIRESMYIPLTGAETGLVSYWQFNDGSGTNLSDGSGSYSGTLYNMDDADWVDSAFPFGSGISETQIVSSTGTVWWDYAGFYMTFTEKTGTDTIVVTDLYNSAVRPKFDVGEGFEAYDTDFWIVNKYGSGTFTGDIQMSVNEDITKGDDDYPALIKLFNRTSNAGGNWSLCNTAYNADEDKDKVYYHDFNSTGQIVVAKMMPSTKGTPGTALEFDGIDDYVNLGNEYLSDFSYITVEMWIKAGDSGTDMDILRKGDMRLLNWDESYEDTKGSGYEIYLPGTGSGWWEFRAPVNKNEWNHIAWEYFGYTGEINAYINGVTVRTDTISTGLIFNSDSLTVSSALSGQPFKGMIDELKIWKDGIGEENLRAGMHLVTDEDRNYPVYYQFNENGGPVIKDNQLYFDGTIHNMDDTARKASSIPFGPGIFTNADIMNSPGTYQAYDADVTFTVYDTVSYTNMLVSRLDTIPNIIPQGPEMLEDHYWVITQIPGTGESITACDMTFGNLPYLSEVDSANAPGIKLYYRPVNSDSDWSVLASASSAEIIGSENEVTFENISTYGQFMICSHNLPGISVTPLYFSETHPMLREVYKDIVIENTGMAELEYSINQSGPADKAYVAVKELLKYNKKTGEAVLQRSVNPLKDFGQADGFSYTWADSDEPGSPLYQWKEIASIGTEIITNGDYTYSNDDGDSLYQYDDCYKKLALPFTFPFYDKFIDSVGVSSNGHLFTEKWHVSDYVVQTMPDTSGINGVIAPFWTDIDLILGGNVYYYHDPADSSFTVQYDDVHEIDCADTTYTFQVTLFQSGKIKFQYKDITDDLSYYGIGIENSEGAQGTSVAVSSPYLKNETAIELIPWLSLDKYAGTVGALTSDTLRVKFSTQNTKGDHYTNSISIESNDPVTPQITIPVDLTVLGPGFSSTFEEINESLGLKETMTKRFSITNTGYGYLGYEIQQTDTFPDFTKLSSTTITAMSPDKKKKNETVSIMPDSKGMGTPDDFGYNWIDSKESDGIDFEWSGISIIGTEVITNGDFTFSDYTDEPGYEYDDCYKTVELPFEFPFYNQRVTSLKISSNGHLLTGDWWNSDYNEQIMPDTTKVNGVIAPFWTDLNPTGSGHIYCYSDIPNSRFIIEYDNVMAWDLPDSTFTFQAVLYSDGKIRFNYLDIQDMFGCTSAGIENMYGNQGITICSDSPFLKNGMSIELKPWLFSSSYTGVLGEGESVEIDIKLDSELLKTGSYSSNLVLNSSLESQPEIICPVNLTVGLIAPPNVVIVNENGLTTISWGEVTGATYYRIFASEDPYGEFTDVTATGAYTGTRWMATARENKMFYYVIAVIGDKKISKKKIPVKRSETR